MLVSSAVAGLNHLLADAPWARERLAPFAGRTAVFSVKPVDIGVGIDNDGYFTEAVAAEPDVALELPLGSLPKAIGGVERAEEQRSDPKRVNCARRRRF